MTTETDLPLYLASTDEKTNIVLGDEEDGVSTRPYGVDDISIGRMPEGGSGDDSDFDLMPRNEAEFPANDFAEDPATAGSADYTFDDEVVGDADPAPFQEPGDEQFPVLKSALAHFQAAEAKPRVVRIDDEESFNDFVCERAVKELDRRVRELRSVIEQHLADHHGAPTEVLRKWDVIGAARAVTDLRDAPTAREAADNFEQVPLDLPDFAKGKVHCWRDGDCVICSIHFHAVDGSKRTATMASRPVVNPDDVAGCAIRAGVNPAVVLGALPDLAAVATGKRLVREVAGAALRAQDRLDVCGMSGEPVVLAAMARPSRAPLSAIMHLQQRCDAGDRQACREMAHLERAASTVLGQKRVAPVLSEARRRLAASRAARRPPTLRQKLMRSYALAAGWV